MIEKLVERIAKLIDVKSLMTLIFTMVVSFKVLANNLYFEPFFEMFKIIVVFYFGTQYAKKTAPKE